MITLAVASGKGGTGKTTIAVNLALALVEQAVQLIDCDVEEPNAHLFVKPVIDDAREIAIPVPKVDLELCNYCGRCAEVCAFNALAVLKDNIMILAELCHGCGSCAYLCPQNAITEVDRPIGILESGNAGELNFVHGRLNPGEAMSAPLINAAKERIDPSRITIIDAPPGTSCPVVAAVSNCDFCLLVTEPTPFGLNDLNLAAQMLDKLDIAAGVVINRCDLGDNRIQDFCVQKGLPILMEIPFDRQLAELYAEGEPVVLHSAVWRDRFQNLYRRIIDFRKEMIAR